MIGNCDMMNLYKAEKNFFLKNAKDLVPRIVIYDDTYAFCLMEKRNPKTYYCFLSKYGLSDKDVCYPSDVIKKLSLEDYYKMSYRLRGMSLKFNLKKNNI